MQGLVQTDTSRKTPPTPQPKLLCPCAEQKSQPEKQSSPHSQGSAGRRTNHLSSECIWAPGREEGFPAAWCSVLKLGLSTGGGYSWLDCVRPGGYVFWTPTLPACKLTTHIWLMHLTPFRGTALCTSCCAKLCSPSLRLVISPCQDKLGQALSQWGLGAHCPPHTIISLP